MKTIALTFIITWAVLLLIIIFFMIPSKSEHRTRWEGFKDNLDGGFRIWFFITLFFAIVISTVIVKIIMVGRAIDFLG
jgi:Na+/H+ antiporter NhaC